MSYPKYVPFETLKGKTLSFIEYDERPEEIHMVTTDGEHYRMSHHQDCCEQVTVEDICGDLKDLKDHPLLVAEEVTSDDPAFQNKDEGSDIEEWTFYKLSTIKGSVTIRWYGSSNGYYGVGVDFEHLPSEPS